MNKDVIYIEPEDDITDILANIKGAKNRVVALVPPKKAGVLRSAVNFKLIAKTATRADKVVVLISNDESLVKLAAAAAMPVAKNLQSKPQLPKISTNKEFGEEPSDVIEGKKPEKFPVKVNKASEEESDSGENKDEDLESVNSEVRPAFKTAKDGPAVKKANKAEEEIIELDEKEDGEKEKKALRGAKIPGFSSKVPNFKKYRIPIIAGSIGLVLLIVFLVWANVVAPAADIAIKIKTSNVNFAEKVTFTTDAEKAKPTEGVFLVEEKSIKKNAEKEFDATGELDKGEKATGTIKVTIPSGTTADISILKNGVGIAAGDVFVFQQLSFAATSSISVSAEELESGGYIDCGTRIRPKNPCSILKSIVIGTVDVRAQENGDKYNIAAASDGWSLTTSDWFASSAKFESSAMDGGVSKISKVVSKEDIENAKNSLSLPSSSEIAEDLSKEFGSEYYIIADSLTSDEAKYTNTPDLEGEVEEGKKAKIAVEKNYKIYAVKRSDLNEYIMAKATEGIGDDTQSVYWTGVVGYSKDVIKNSNSVKKDKMFFENFSKGESEMSAKLKSTVFIGPEITEDMVYEKALGKKTGEVQTAIKSINGVSEVSVKTSYFWVYSIPNDKSKVHIDVSLAE